MTAPMSMNRVIHAAVRRDLARLEDALGVVRDGDRERAGQLQRAFANLHDELIHHHEGEDQWIFPMLAGFDTDPDLLAAMDAEHNAMAEALSETAAAMDAFAASGSAADATKARESVVHTRTVVDRHLTHEENDLDPLLVPHLESTEWKAVERKLRSRPPGAAGRFFAWIQDGMADDERTYLRSTVPPPVTFVLGRLFGRSYHRDIAPVWKN